MPTFEPLFKALDTESIDYLRARELRATGAKNILEILTSKITNREIVNPAITSVLKIINAFSKDDLSLLQVAANKMNRLRLESIYQGLAKNGALKNPAENVPALTYQLFMTLVTQDLDMQSLRQEGKLDYQYQKLSLLVEPALAVWYPELYGNASALNAVEVNFPGYQVATQTILAIYGKNMESREERVLRCREWLSKNPVKKQVHQIELPQELATQS